MRKYTILILFTIHFVSNGQERGFHQKAISQSRDSILSLMERSVIPGLAIAVSIDGKLVWSEGFGYADLEQGVRVDPATTRFRIGSISKSLTAAALGKLLEKGRIQLDSSIYYYLPDYPRHKYRPTVRQVAGHIGGIRHYKENEFLISKHFESVTAGLTIFKDDSLLFAPGTGYQYSSHGFNLLSAILEKATKSDFLALMRETVFDPLGLLNTAPDLNDSIIAGRTRFYELRDGRWVNAPYVDNSYKWAGGGFISSAEDICRFGNALLSNNFLQRETIETLTASQKLADGSLTGYGIGFATGKDFSGATFFGHTGGSVGGTSEMVIYPEQRIVVVLLTNLSNARMRQMARQVAHLFMH